MFDLVKSDLFNEGDVIVTFKPGDNETKTKVIAALKEAGLNQWGYSNRADHEQYLFVGDYDKRKDDHLRSCMNSLSLPAVIKAKLSEPVV